MAGQTAALQTQTLCALCALLRQKLWPQKNAKNTKREQHQKPSGSIPPHRFRLTPELSHAGKLAMNKKSSEAKPRRLPGVGSSELVKWHGQKLVISAMTTWSNHCSSNSQ